MVIIRYASASSPVFFLYLSDLTTVWLSTKNTASPGSLPVEIAHSLTPQETKKAEYLSAPLYHFQTVTISHVLTPAPLKLTLALQMALLSTVSWPLLFIH